MSRNREDEAGGVSDTHIGLRLRRRGDGVVSLSRFDGEGEGEAIEEALDRVKYVDLVLSDLIGVKVFSSFFILGLAVALRLLTALGGIMVSVAGSPRSDSSGVELRFEGLISFFEDSSAVELPGCKNRARAPLKVVSLLTGISPISSGVQSLCSSRQSWEASSGAMIYAISENTR